MKRDTRTAYRARAAATERMIDAAVAEVAAARREAWQKAADAAAKQEAERHRFTRDELEGVTHIRTPYLWHEVVRVNAKSVTVKTGYSWTVRVKFDDILDVRTVTA